METAAAHQHQVAYPHNAACSGRSRRALRAGFGRSCHSDIARLTCGVPLTGTYLDSRQRSRPDEPTLALVPRTLVNGTELFYEVDGGGAPCVVLHGGLGVDHTLYRRTLGPSHSSFTLRANSPGGKQDP